ncbi:antibiotic biosynthesis monooxygenase [Microbacterium sp. NPDC077663]|uniref:antibiotic biosynthesis monooxygenase n=1 Tax=Microbacterium sp. NPDC077663 TaxID=3364189 RepID=UPI0037C9DC2F
MMSIHVLAEVRIEELSRFLEVFGDEGLAKRREHGSRGATVYEPQDDTGRVLVLLEFDSTDAYDSFRADETAPPIMRKGGAQGPPTFTVLREVGRFDS